MPAIGRRPTTKFVKLLAVAADPAVTFGSAVMPVYAKLVGGVAHFFGRSTDGIVQQMTGPGAILPTDYADGMLLSWVSVTQVQVAEGRVRSDDDTYDIALAAATTAAITASGVNGLDAGAEAASTWYAVWAIGDSTGVNPGATLLSASFSAPTLPVGYDKKRRVGCVRNSAGSDFLNFQQRWNGRTRRYWYQEARATLQVLTNGNATVFTSVPCANRVPPSSRNMILSVEFLAPSVGGAVSDQVTLRPTGGVSSIIFRLGQTGTASAILDMEMQTSDAQSIDYQNSDADDVTNLFVLAFDDEI